MLHTSPRRGASATAVPLHYGKEATVQSSVGASRGGADSAPLFAVNHGLVATPTSTASLLNQQQYTTSASTQRSDANRSPARAHTWMASSAAAATVPPFGGEDGGEDRRAAELRARRRERCVDILTQSDMPQSVRESLLVQIDQDWVVELLELHDDRLLPRKHWVEWCTIAANEGPRYPYIVRSMQTRRLPLA